MVPWLSFGILITVAASCSGSSKGKATGPADENRLRAVERAVVPAAVKWATAARAIYQQQITSGGRVDDAAAEQSLKQDAQDVINVVCSRASADKQLSKGNQTLDLNTAVRNKVADVFIQVTASDPRLLVSFGMETWDKWPPFMLKEPRAAGAQQVSVTTEALATFVKPEYLDGKGGFVIPPVDSAAYNQFSQWYYFDKSRQNALLNQALTASQPIQDGVQRCSNPS